MRRTLRPERPIHLLLALHPHVRASLVALAGAAMLILGFPGLDGVSPRWLADEASRAEQRGSALGWARLAVADFNRLVKTPAERWVAPLQRPLRIAQSWRLYGSGPNRVRRSELWVDGVLRWRSGDADADWSWPLLRYRRVRPVLVAACHGDGPNAPHLVALLARKAVRDFGARELELRCTAARWPGDGDEKVTHRWVTRAPGWVPEALE